MKIIHCVLALLLMAAPLSSAKASPMTASVCKAIAEASAEMPILFIQSNCAQANREVMYGAAAAVGGYNVANTQAILGMLQVENSCGGQPNTATCDGRYTIRANCSGCTAYGAAQILRGTWIDLTSGSNRTTLINRLGGCGAEPAASGLAGAATRDGVSRGQFNAFRRAICDNPSGVASASGHQQWGSYSAVSILVANLLDGRSTVVMGRNPGATTALNGLNINANEVGMYCTHNLGEGGCNSFMRGMANNPNASVSTVLSRQVMTNNWGLYCTSSSCAQPLTFAQAAQRMSASMRRGNCVTEGLSRIGATPTGTVPVSPNGVYAQPGVNTQAGVDNARALQEMQTAVDSGGAAGTMNNNCMTGSSTYKGACGPVQLDPQEVVPAPAAAGAAGGTGGASGGTGGTNTGTGGAGTGGTGTGGTGGTAATGGTAGAAGTGATAGAAGATPTGATATTAPRSPAAATPRSRPAASTAVPQTNARAVTAQPAPSRPCAMDSNAIIRLTGQISTARAAIPGGGQQGCTNYNSSLCADFRANRPMQPGSSVIRNSSMCNANRQVCTAYNNAVARVRTLEGQLAQARTCR